MEEICWCMQSELSKDLNESSLEKIELTLSSRRSNALVSLVGVSVKIWGAHFTWISGLPWCLRQWSVCLQCGRPGFHPWVGKISWRKKRQPTPVFLPGKFHGWRSLVGYSPWGCKDSDTTKRLHFHFSLSDKQQIMLKGYVPNIAPDILVFKQFILYLKFRFYLGVLFFFF